MALRSKTVRGTTWLAAVAILGLLSSTAVAQDKITFLLPAPGFLPAFAPFQIAKHKGYYKTAGLDVTFEVGKGGVDVAKQVGAGNADLGCAVGDTSIIVRPNGVPVRSVALLGGRALAQIIVRQDAGIKTLADLKGKTVAVMSYSDNIYYSFLAAISKFGLTKSDVNVEAVGPAGTVQLVAADKAVAMAGVPEWAVAVETAGVPVKMYSVEKYFPGMAQAIVASDDAIKNHPARIKGFVHATLMAITDIMKNPSAAAKDYVEAVPQHKDKLGQIEKILTLYAKDVYPGQTKLGWMDSKRVAAVQDYYLKIGAIRTKTKLDELYTNKFIE
jgi:NitT/TauT family transport system substrate-binding protein